MKNYQLPTKKATLWENNPFNNMTIGQFKTEQTESIYKQLLQAKGATETTNFLE